MAWLIVWDVASCVSIFTTLLLGGRELQVLEVLGILDIALFFVRVLDVLIAGESDMPIKRERKSSRGETAWAWGTATATMVVTIITTGTTANNGLAAFGAGVSTVVVLATLRVVVKRRRQVQSYPGDTTGATESARS